MFQRHHKQRLRHCRESVKYIENSSTNFNFLPPCLLFSIDNPISFSLYGSHQCTFNMLTEIVLCIVCGTTDKRNQLGCVEEVIKRQ